MLRSGGYHPGNLARILKSLEEAHQADPQWERPRIILAGLLINQLSGSRKSALLQRIERLLAPLDKPNGKNQGDAVFIKGILALFREDVVASMNLLNRASALMPSNPEVYRVRSEIHLLQGQDQLAREAILKARAADPRNANTMVQLVTIHWLSGSFELALKALAPYLAIQDRQIRLGADDPDLRLGLPRSMGAHAIRGMMMMYLGRLEPAAKELQIELSQLSKRSGFGDAMMEAYTYYGLSIYHHFKGQKRRYDGFRRRARRAIKRHLASKGNPNLALASTLWVIAPLLPDPIGPLLDRWGQGKQPFYADVQVVRAAALARMGKSKDARSLLAKAVSLAPKDRQKGLRQVFRRFVRMCRKVDAHWKKQGLKLPPPARPLQMRGLDRPGREGRRRKRKPKKAPKSR